MLLDAIERLEDGDRTYLAAAFCALATGDAVLVSRSGSVIRKLLEQYSMRKMIRLSEAFRQYTSLEWTIDWKKVNLKKVEHLFASKEDYKYSLILGSFHPNGYFRESCTKHLVSLPDTLPYLILRLNDWVPVIRKRASGLILDKIAACPIEEVLYSTEAFDKIKWSLRRENKYFTAVDKQINLRIEKDTSNISLYQITKYEFGIRKNIYKTLFEHKEVELELALILLDIEKHSFCNIIIINGILKHYDCPPSLIEDFLHHKHAYVRRRTLEYKYALEKNVWIGLEQMLLDSSRAVRELTVFILKKHHSKFSIGDFYIEHLQDENPAYSIIGMGEQHVKGAINLLLPFLEHSQERVIKHTLLALGRFEEFDGWDIYWKYLLDSRISISQGSFRAIWGRQIRYGAEVLYQTYRTSELEHVKCYLVKLLFLENSWIRLPYLLELYGEEILNVVYQDKAIGKATSRNMFETISQEQGKRIERALELYQEKFSENFISEILFELKFVVKKS